MSQENVEVVREVIEAWNAGDMAALRETYDPEAVMFHLKGWPEPGPSVGRDAVMRQWEIQREGGDGSVPVVVVPGAVHAACELLG